MVNRAIYCAGEQGRVVLDILQETGNTEDIVFLDDDESRHGTSLDGFPVIGDVNALKTCDDPVYCLVAFGDSRSVRLDIAQKAKDACSGFFNALHPEATISSTASVGNGVTINAQSYVGPEVSVRDHVLIDSCVNISHDVTIKQGATIAPNATLAGGVTIERDAYIGANATIIEDVVIGEHTLVGAGAVVTESVGRGITVAGIPAEPL